MCGCNAGRPSISSLAFASGFYAQDDFKSTSLQRKVVCQSRAFHFFTTTSQSTGRVIAQQGHLNFIQHSEKEQ